MVDGAFGVVDAVLDDAPEADVVVVGEVGVGELVVEGVAFGGLAAGEGGAEDVLFEVVVLRGVWSFTRPPSPSMWK